MPPITTISFSHRQIPFELDLAARTFKVKQGGDPETVALRRRDFEHRPWCGCMPSLEERKARALSRVESDLARLIHLPLGKDYFLYNLRDLIESSDRLLEDAEQPVDLKDLIAPLIEPDMFPLHCAEAMNRLRSDLQDLKSRARLTPIVSYDLMDPWSFENGTRSLPPSEVRGIIDVITSAMEACPPIEREAVPGIRNHGVNDKPGRLPVLKKERRMPRLRKELYRRKKTSVAADYDEKTPKRDSEMERPTALKQRPTPPERPLNFLDPAKYNFLDPSNPILSPWTTAADHRPPSIPDLLFPGLGESFSKPLEQFSPPAKPPSVLGSGPSPEAEKESAKEGLKVQLYRTRPERADSGAPLKSMHEDPNPAFYEKTIRRAKDVMRKLFISDEEQKAVLGVVRDIWVNHAYGVPLEEKRSRWRFLKGRRTRGGPIIELRKKKKTEPYFECIRQSWLPYYGRWKAEVQRRCEELGDPTRGPLSYIYDPIYKQVTEQMQGEFLSSKPQMDAYLDELQDDVEEVYRLRKNPPFRSFWITPKNVPYYGEGLENFWDAQSEFLQLWEDLSRSLGDRKICIECLAIHIYSLGGGVHRICNTFFDVERRSDRKEIISWPFTRKQEIDCIDFDIYTDFGKALWKIYCVRRDEYRQPADRQMNEL